MIDLSHHKDRTHRAVVVLGGCALAFIALSPLWLAWLMYFDDAPPFTSPHVFLTDAAGNMQDRFKAGQIVVVYRDLCFDRDVSAQFGRSLQSVEREPEININIDSTNSMMLKGCVKNGNIIKIPDHTPPGLYRYRVVMQYSNNAFSNSAFILPMPTIEIVP